jgi:transcriptional regulator with XRE-family HTH domain
VARFGEFFRQRRLNLGLTLREFSRRNGFDPGNISRLERGQSPPPKSRKTLQLYAKSLALQPDSDDWSMFFDLAAVETGSIPPGIREQDTALRRLPAVFRRLRGKTSQPGPWTNEAALESWADVLDAR